MYVRRFFGGRIPLLAVARERAMVRRSFSESCMNSTLMSGQFFDLTTGLTTTMSSS
jgi:hypothetical protein